MRRLAAGLSISLIVSLAGCAQAGAWLGFDPPDLTYSLTRILLWQEKNTPALAAALLPGLSRSEIEKLAGQHKVVLSEEVYSLYGWRNGMREGTPFFDVYRFVPLSEALQAGDELHHVLRADPYRLPVFQSILSNDFYGVVCARSPQARTPVEFFLDGASPEMDDLTTFVHALATSFEKGVFTGNANGGPITRLDTNQPAFERVLLDFRPRRNADVEAILSGKGSSLPVKREMQALQDLTETEHPRAGALISQAMGRWLYRRDSRFTGLLLLAHVNTPDSLARLQATARDPDPEVRRDVYATLAWQVQWGERHLDDATVKAALVDLTNVNPRLCDGRDIARVLRWAPDNRVVPSLIGLLNGLQDACARDTRVAAAQSLGHLGDRSAVNPLLARLGIETDKGAQFSLMAALADLGNSEGERQLRLRIEGMDQNSLRNSARGGAGGSAAEQRIAGELLARFKQ
jgi:hypothetical protein